MMKQTNLILLTSLTLAAGISLPAYAVDQDSAKAEAQAQAQAQTQANEAKTQASLTQAQAKATQAEAAAKAEALVQVEYQRTLTEANRSRSEAQAAVTEARIKLEKAKLERREAQREISAERRAEIEAMREQLNRTHAELRESSRELSQINRELMLVTQSGVDRQLIISGGSTPVIGVVLGSKKDVGVEVLGVSPNGPAERAGVQAGDVIVAVGGRVLSSVDNTGDVRGGLIIALNDLKASEPVIVSVERGVDTLDLKVTPEVREPLTWQSVVRFPSLPAAPPAAAAPSAGATPAAAGAPSVPSAPNAPHAVVAPADVNENVFFERIVVEELDREALAEQIARMEVEIEQRGGPPHDSHWLSGDTDGYEFYFGDMSELGDFALSDASGWYGMSLTSGLRLAQIDPALGEYFDTDRGVLVLSAKQDNALLLLTGDVVLSLHGSEVNSPADFMRALREFAPGEELQINIKRKRENRTLKPVISDEQARLLVPRVFENFQVFVGDNGS